MKKTKKLEKNKRMEKMAPQCLTNNIFCQ